MSSVERTRTIALGQAVAVPGVDVDTLSHLPNRGQSNDLRIHCPRCRRPIDISVDGELTSLVCTACHAKFNVAGERDESQRAEAILTVAHF